MMLSAWFIPAFIHLLTVRSILFPKDLVPIVKPGRTSVGFKSFIEEEPIILDSSSVSADPTGFIAWNGGQVLTHKSNLESPKGRSETTIASTRDGNIIFIAFNSAQGFCEDNSPDHPTCPGVPQGYNNGGSHYTVSLDAGKTWKYMYGPPFLGTNLYTRGDPWFSMGGKSGKDTQELLYFTNAVVDKNEFTNILGLSVHVARIIYHNDDPTKKAINYEWIRASLIPKVKSDDLMDKPAIAADPYHANKAYVSLTLFDSDITFDIQVYATHDAAKSWKGPVVLQDGYAETSIVNQYTYPLVNANGDVYVVWWEFDSGNGPDVFLSSSRFVFVRSTNGGNKFSEKIVINPAFIKFNPFFQPVISYNRPTHRLQPTMDVFSNKKNKKYLNRIIATYTYAVEPFNWDDAITGFIDDDSSVLNSINIGVSYSDNKGKTWHFVDPFKDDIPKKLVKRIWPTVSVSSDGKSVNIAYLQASYIKQPNLPICNQNWGTRTSYYHDMVDTYYIHSNDGGISWSYPTKLNDKPVDWCTTWSNIAPNFGDYMLGITDSSGYIHLAGVTNGFTLRETSEPMTAPDTIYYTSKHMIDESVCDIIMTESCNKKQECCTHWDCIGNRVNEITCSANVKWKINKHNEYCCIKNMGKCRNDYECCGGKTKCIDYECHDSGQWRKEKRRLIDGAMK